MFAGVRAETGASLAAASAACSIAAQQSSPDEQPAALEQDSPAAIGQSVALAQDADAFAPQPNNAAIGHWNSPLLLWNSFETSPLFCHICCPAKPIPAAAASNNGTCSIVRKVLDFTAACSADWFSIMFVILTRV